MSVASSRPPIDLTPSLPDFSLKASLALVLAVSLAWGLALAVFFFSLTLAMADSPCGG
jgi:hypothetical protein